jgi:hypothetical protein
LLKDASVIEQVPIIPDLATFRVFKELNEDGEEVLRGESTIDKAEVYIINSSLYKGPYYETEDVGSPYGILLAEFETLVTMENYINTALFSIINPTIFIESIPRESGGNEAAGVNTVPTGDLDLGQPARTLYEVQPINISAKRLKDMRELTTRVFQGEVIDPVDNIAALPPTYRISSHPPAATIPPLFAENRQRFDVHVASVMRVPESFLTAHQGTLVPRSALCHANAQDRPWKDHKPVMHPKTTRLD